MTIFCILIPIWLTLYPYCKRKLHFNHSVCPQGASAEEVKRMEKEVREQEQLLAGYQQENERLYKELKQMQAKEKANEARMFSENQKLGKEYFFRCLIVQWNQ